MAYVKCIVCPYHCENFSICGKFEVPNKFIVKEHEIEQIGFYHVLPGSKVYYLETYGCNLGCRDCIFPHIFTKGYFNQERLEKKYDVVIISCSANKNFELVSKIRDQTRLLGIVTHGFITSHIFEKYLEMADFMLFVLFGSSSETYAKLTITRKGFTLIKDNLIKALRSDIFIEIRYVVYENLNDNPDEIKRITNLIANNRTDIPFHIKRFYAKTSNRAPTRNEKLFHAYNTAKKSGLEYVYIDDLYKHEVRNTYYGKELVIERIGDRVVIKNHELLRKIPILLSFDDTER